MPRLLVNGMSKSMDCLVGEPKAEIVERCITNILDEVRSHLEALEVDSTFFPEILNIACLNTSIQRVGHRRSARFQVSHKCLLCPRQIVHRGRGTREIA